MKPQIMPNASTGIRNTNKILKRLIKDHCKAYEEECRWCFAIDLQRVKANLVVKYNFPDATILHMKCPRCGGEYSYYFREWGEDYIKERIMTLHPEIRERITDDMIRTINYLLWPEDA
jgi:transcription initiation factor IIE alpha subunit